MTNEKFKLQIITPERVLYDHDVEMVTFEATEGEITVLNDHIPLSTTLTSGKVVIKNGDSGELGVLHGGFAEIQEDSVTLLSDAAEWAHEIDIERAKAAKQRAEERLEKGYDEAWREARQRAALLRAVARIKTAEYHQMNNK